MTRSADCSEGELFEVFWPFAEAVESQAVLAKWVQCPFAARLEDIERAEKALWFTFPSSYVLFLLGWNGFNISHHGRGVGSVQFLCCLDYDLAEAPVPGGWPEWADIVRCNAGAFRWPQQPCDMLNFAGDEYGNSYGFVPTSGAESRVAYWNHDCCETTILADNFADWLNLCVPKGEFRGRE